MYCKIENGIDKNGRRRYRANYTYTVIKDGKNKQVHTRTGWFSTSKEAKKDAEMKYNLKNNKPVETAPKAIEKCQQTMGMLMEAYLENLKSTPLCSMSAGSKRTHVGTMNTLMTYTPTQIKKYKICKFTKEDMEIWLNALATIVLEKTGQVMDADYYARHRTEIKKVLAFGKANLYFQKTMNLYDDLLRAIQTDIETRKTLPVYRKPKKEFRYLNYAEFRQFLAKNKNLDGFKERDKAFDVNAKVFKFSRDYMYYVMFNFFFYTGVRTEELRGITWNDIIYNRGTHLNEVDINKAYTNHVLKDDRDRYINDYHNLKNEDSLRRIPILPQLDEILEEYRIYYEIFFEDIGDKFLFFGKDGPTSLIGYSTIQNQINSRTDSTKIHHISMHDFRRSCAMYLIVELDCDEEEIFRFFGHKDVEMLQDVYAEKDRLRRAKKLNDTLKAKLDYLSEHREGCAYEKFDFETGKPMMLRTRRNDYNNYYDRVPYGTKDMLPRVRA